jgi:hypothetical protein
VKYFFDNCISFRLAHMLKAIGEDVEALRDAYPQDTKDPDLFRQLKGRNLVYLSGDTSQTTQMQESRALKECGITALFLGPFWGKLTFWPQAIWLIRHWQTIDGFAKGVAAGTCAEIKSNAKARVFQL